MDTSGQEHPTKFRNVWKNIQSYNPSTGEVTHYADLDVALAKLFPIYVPPTARATIIASIQSGSRAYNLYWRSKDNHI